MGERRLGWSLPDWRIRAWLTYPAPPPVPARYKPWAYPAARGHLGRYHNL